MSALPQHQELQTAIIKVTNGILMAIEKQKVVLLVVLDLSTAFIMTDHTILLKCYLIGLGIKGMAQSYLSDRYQYVNVESQSSRFVPVNHTWYATGVSIRPNPVQHLYNMPC